MSWGKRDDWTGESNKEGQKRWLKNLKKPQTLIN